MRINLLFGSLILLAFLFFHNMNDYLIFDSKVWAQNVQCINTAPCTESKEKIIQCLGDAPCVSTQQPNLNFGDLNSSPNRCSDVSSKSNFNNGVSESKLSELLDEPDLEDNLIDNYDDYRPQCSHD